MKKLNITIVATSLLFSGSLYAGWNDLLNEVTGSAETTEKQTVESVNKAAETTQAVKSASEISLTDTLVKQLGVSPEQALGGSGALFQTAKGNMSEADFSQLGNSVPGIDGMLSAAPKAEAASTSSTASLLSGLASASGNKTLTDAASLVNSFSQLGLSEEMISKFSPVVVDYVKQTGGEQMSNLLATALSGL